MQETDNTQKTIKTKKGISIFEMSLFSMFGAMMFLTKFLMQVFPNVHLLGMFIVLLTVVYRVKALIPLYVYVLIDGLFAGFAMWWIPYLYIWTVLWGMTMLLPKNMSKKAQFIVYPIVCSLHGFLFGTLYAPAQAIMFSLSFEQTVAWIIAGLPFDFVHGVSNYVVGYLIYPLKQLLLKLNKGNKA